MQQSLTAKFIEQPAATLVPAGRKQLDYWDVVLPGFGLRVSIGGAGNLAARRPIRSVIRQMAPVFDAEWPLATPKRSNSPMRERWRGRFSLRLRQGEDPGGQKLADRIAETFEELASDYLERHAKPNKRSWRDDERILNAEILPHLRRLKVAFIRRGDVHRLIGDIRHGAEGRKKAPVLANRTLALARKIFNFGIENSIIENNPCYQVKATKETARQRFLTTDEMRRFWRALDAEEAEGRYSVAGFFRIKLLTGQRDNEVLHMRWEDIIDEGNGAIWTIPGAYTKNGLAHRVPLSDSVIEIVREIDRCERADRERANVWRQMKGLRLRERSHWVFRSERDGSSFTDSEVRDVPLKHLRKAFERIRAASGIAHFNPHDLRRTMRTRMRGDLKFSSEVGERVLNHIDRGIKDVYDRYDYDDEKRAALVAWDAFVRRVVQAEGNQEEGRRVLVFAART